MHNVRAACAALVLVGGLLGLSARQAHAASEEERIEHLNKKAMEDYDALEFDSARRTLVDCIAKLRAAGLDETALAAKTHINLGIVYIAGFHDRGRGQQQFERALQIDPSLKLDAAVATPELQKAWDAAVRAAGKKRRGKAQEPATEVPRPSPSDPAQPSAPPADALQHVPPDEVPVGQRVSIYARPTVNIARATLFYRAPGQERYAQTAMGRSRKQPGDIVGQIPAEVVAGRSLQYYIEAYDGAGAIVGRQGTPDSPFVISVIGGKAVPAAMPGEDLDDPLAQARREEAARNAPRPFREHVYFDVGLGSAFPVVAPGALTEVAWYYDSKERRYQQARASSGGGVWGGLGMRAEVGGYVWKGLSVGISGRFELYLNHNADSSVNSEKLCGASSGSGTAIPCYTTTSMGNFGVIVLGKLRYQFRRGTSFRPFVHFNIGGGEWRGALNIDGSKPMAGGMVDPRSPLQPTDICSANFNKDARDPENCKAPYSGYNFKKPEEPLVINTVCPKEGPCVDAVLMGRAMVGAGAGFYAGGKHAGFFLDLTLLAAFGGAEFGFIPEIYAGPQFIF